MNRRGREEWKRRRSRKENQGKELRGEKGWEEKEKERGEVKERMESSKRKTTSRFLRLKHTGTIWPNRKAISYVLQAQG